jgi:NHS family xanthosine MFS transporter
MVIFFLFAMLLGAALQITNAFGKPFLDDFGKIDAYRESFGVKHSNILISISQISETLFILAIPYFLKKFGIKIVMLISIFAWVFRFGLFGIGNPGSGLWLLILSMIIYGMAFDFFNISGSLFVEKEADIKIRASAQGLFMVMTNGVGAYLGGVFSGMVVDHFTTNGLTDWRSTWFAFAGYALVLGIIFPIVFKYKHDPKAMQNIHVEPALASE